ncbi:MAG: DNA-directed RNA polymerase subunit beta' [Thermodesulfovibrio sp.]|nr:DNA-directed RNA polymerase subunit beta' [Thermodesulfovibrio sp.]
MKRFSDVECAVIGLLDPLKILEMSGGEVSVPHTLDTKGKAVERGLLCEKIFGPMEHMRCRCGKRHLKVKVCPDCGVEANNPIVRRHRFGHITLASPVVHPWFRKIIASYLNIPPRKLDGIILCELFLVEHPGTAAFKKGDLISSGSYFDCLREKHKGFRASTGAALIKKMLTSMDSKAEMSKLRKLEPSRRVNRRLLLLRDIHESGINPALMVMDVLPVLPAGLRPVIVFDNGTTASSDLNDLYARVISRNRRLSRWRLMQAPGVLVNTEQRALQEAVDSLLDKKYVTKNRTGKKILKTLTSMIEGKGGRIRRNLLGKRVDYSGRSVIVVGPNLKLHQCGLPIELAMGLMRPFVYGRLRQTGMAPSLSHAMMLCDMMHDTAIDALEYVTSEMVVLLNRAPSLHRMSIQAFEPVLHKERALRLHPLTCSSFNADFDGDQMGVHLPITLDAQVEAKVLMLATNNIISPASGKVAMVPSQDMVLGLYYMTKDRKGALGEGKIFADKADALTAHDHGVIDLHALVRVRMEEGTVETTAGRLQFAEVFPPEIPFSSLNKLMRKKDVSGLIELVYDRLGNKATVTLLDNLKDLGYRNATLSGVSLCIHDMTIPQEKDSIIRETEVEVKEILRSHSQGTMDDQEKHNKIVAAWIKASDTIASVMMEKFGITDPNASEDDKKIAREFNSMFMMADSGARGSKDQIRQLAGMRGLMAKPNGDIIEMPIKSNFREGLTYFEYLLSCHGARKGRADGALKTANAGYFTRRLVDAAHDVVINAIDCGTRRGFPMKALLDNDVVKASAAERVRGRVLCTDLSDPVTQEIIAIRGDLVTKEISAKIRDAEISEVIVRSPIFCDLEVGMCATCYGADMASRQLPEIGDAVGILAAQSIGEPGTQLTLRTFHSGGTASGGGSSSHLEAKYDGKLHYVDVLYVKDRNGSKVVVSRSGKATIFANGLEKEAGGVRYGSTLLAQEGDDVKKGQKIIEWDPFSRSIIATAAGSVTYEGMIKGTTVNEVIDAETGISQLYVTNILPTTIPTVLIGEKQYMMPMGAMVILKQEQVVLPGDIIAKLPGEASKNADITGGLTRVLQLLEVRLIDEPAVLAAIDGQVKIGQAKNGFITISIEGGGSAREHRIRVGRQINYLDGDWIKTGDILAEGIVDARDILDVFGPAGAAAYVIDEVQKIYKSQGVDIDDKHFEIILRKMLRKVVITEAGSTDFVPGEKVSWHKFLRINKAPRGARAKARFIIMSLTKAALESDSWLSAASFQNTKEILSNAAVRKAKDPLTGTKENIIIGRMVPVGTGHPHNKNVFLLPPKQAEQKRQRDEAIKKLSSMFG